MKKQASRISNKLTKTRVLAGSRELQRHIPATQRMSKHALHLMLKKYKMVYIKPCCGSLGEGVIRVEQRQLNNRSNPQERNPVRKGKLSYRYQAGLKVNTFRDYDQAYKAILEESGGKPYLVQKGIRLLSYSGRPFDIRVMVQRNSEGKWEATGAAGRVAHPQKVVTNGSQGGSIYPVEELLSAYAGIEKRSALIAQMNELGVKTAIQLSSVYPALQEIGVDLAVDRRLALWILEVNTAPDPCPFTKLKDTRMLDRIIRYGKAYGRTYNLKCMKAKRGMM
ncbi:YheC/YheD family protein [Paenibacillus sp. MMS20-IR301]|uniref:YheC/YheD family protein n=1 Tax=Paenibacillus sp. MMS20-IR301 TaxID=2895946 RepID=UPI0028E1907D|nr:YheC/YheD family protein [Paenibacillus sp. MMS20-IR301]WNS46003.1 YheC/YheD family protein [Paenibacillus sp. MMS20-IR301]